MPKVERVDPEFCEMSGMQPADTGVAKVSISSLQSVGTEHHDPPFRSVRREEIPAGLTLPGPLPNVVEYVWEDPFGNYCGVTRSCSNSRVPSHNTLHLPRRVLPSSSLYDFLVVLIDFLSFLCPSVVGAQPCSFLVCPPIFCMVCIRVSVGAKHRRHSLVCVFLLLISVTLPLFHPCVFLLIVWIFACESGVCLRCCPCAC